MAKALPNWLVNKYFTLFLFFGLLPFTIEDAKGVLRSKKTSILLFKMASYGWVDRVERGVYRVIHPFIALMEVSGLKWRDRIKQKDRLPVLELTVVKLFEVLGSNLVSIVLFGSLSKGEAKPESDIDLLVVASGLPSKYSERTKIIREIVSSKLMDEIIIQTWKKKGVYADLNIMLVDDNEANITHPFYLDMTKDCVIIYDKNESISKKIAEVRGKLEKIGAKRFEEPNGSWYWVLTPKAEDVKDVVL